MRPLADDLSRLDRLIHEPARLVIMTALAAARSADFLFLLTLTGLSAGNLSGHLTRLEEAGCITQRKEIVGKRPKTTASITEAGRTAIAAHWQQLEEVRKKAQAVTAPGQ